MRYSIRNHRYSRSRRAVIGGLAAAIATALAPALEPRGGLAAAQSVDNGAKGTIIDFKPLTVPVIRSGRVRGQAVVALTLVTPAVEVRQAVAAQEPALRDAFLTSLYRYGAAGYLERAPLDLDRIKERLQAVADRVVGPSRVQVLIQGAQIIERR